MKKLIPLLISLLAVGFAAGLLMTRHPEWQRELPTSYVVTEKDDDDEDVPVQSEEDAKKLSVEFSKSGTFYGENIEVELTSGDENAVIYYTLNGNDPDESAKKYSGPIKLNAKNRAAATTIKAVAVSGEERSETALKSYVVGKNISERFTEDTLVFILSSDEYNLYDYYNGIAVEGYLRDEYMKNEYDGGEINPTLPANYNIRGRESERDMYVEVYDSTGRQLISQAAGARVVGGYSRANDQKSFRLIARNSYSEGNGKFKYPFFGDDRDAYGNIITRYDRITLRDGANDREFAGVRDELSMTLSFDAGFKDVQSVRPAAVFLNSEYYGFAWLHEAYSNDYLEMMYGGSKDNFRIVGSKELEIESDDPEDEQAVADWKHVVELAEGDLTVEANFREFCELVDLDDLMLYYAIQIYIDNKDWPGNNFKAWRYYPADGETVTSEYLEGRWRFLLFDAEFAWGLYGNGYRDNTLYNVLYGEHMQGHTHVLRGLLARKDMREKFANTLCELCAGAFSSANIKSRLEELIAKSDHEQVDYALKNGYVSSWANEWSFIDSREQIKVFANMRFSVLRDYIAELFEYGGEMYRVDVSSPVGAVIKTGSQTVENGESLNIEYFKENSVTLSASFYDGFTFGHWDINGESVFTPEITVDASMCGSDGEIHIGLYPEQTEKTRGVCIGEVYTAGDGDWIKLYNPTSSPVRIKGWHLSDKADMPDRYTIPDTEIPAGETVMIVCKNNSEQSALMKHQTNFNLKIGETLYFSDPDCNIISSVPILEMTPDKSLSLGIDGMYHIGAVSE